jgi:hypothetical protein
MITMRSKRHGLEHVLLGETEYFHGGLAVARIIVMNLHSVEQMKKCEQNEVVGTSGYVGNADVVL